MRPILDGLIEVAVIEVKRGAPRRAIKTNGTAVTNDAFEAWFIAAVPLAFQDKQTECFSFHNKCLAIRQRHGEVEVH